MFRRFFTRVLTPALLVSTSVGIFAQPCPDNSPVITGPGVVSNNQLGVIYSTPNIPGHTYAWTVSGGTIGSGAGTNQITVNWGNIGTGLITLTETNPAASCSTTVNKSVSIRPLLISYFYYTNTSCYGDVVSFWDASVADANNPIVSYYWTFGDGATSTLQNPVHQYMPPFNTTYTVTLVVTNQTADKDTIIDAVYVNPDQFIPDPSFTVDVPACQYTPVIFNSTASTTPPGTGNIIHWDWNFNDPGSGAANLSTLQNPTHVFSTTGIFNVRLEITNERYCKNDTIVQVTILASVPDAQYSFSTPTCLNNPVNFTDLSTYPAGRPITTWIWNFGDGSSPVTINAPSNPNYTYTYPDLGPYPARLTVINSIGCRDSITQNISLDPSPIADFSYDAACTGDTVPFTNLTILNNGPPIASYYWDFDDPGSYGNTSTLQNPSHVFTGAGTFHVMLVSTNTTGCPDTIVKDVIVFDPPAVEYTWHFGSQNNEIQFHIDSTITNLNLIGNMCLWNFGDGSWGYGHNPVHIYPAAGTFLVTLSVSDTVGCTNEVTHVISVPSIPVAFFASTSPVCDGQPVCFTDLSSVPTPPFGYIVTWIWNFGDGSPNDTVNFPNSPNVCHLYSVVDTFTVTLTVIDNSGYTDDYSADVVIKPNPIANFIFTVPCNQQVVSFTDLSTPNGGGNIITWDWNFNDPGSGTNNVSNLQNPVHTFTNGNTTYWVRLIVVNFNDCRDTIIKPVYVFPSPPVEFTHDTACLNAMVTFIADTTITQVDSIVSWAWNFGDGTPVSTDPITTQHLYAAAGNYTATLTVIDHHGCQNSVSHGVRVNPLPVSNFTWNSPNCQFDSVLFTDQSYIPVGFTGYIAKWHWDFGDGTTQTIVLPGNPNIWHTFAGISTSYTVRLTVWSNDSCTQFIDKTVNLIPAPIANFTFSSTNCQNQPICFTDLSQQNGGGLITFWSWNFGDPASGMNNFSTLQNPCHTFSTAGTYTVLLTVTNTNNCNDTIQKTVTVNLLPVADFTADSVCQGNPTTFTDLSVPNAASIISWSWDFGDGTPLNILPSPTHTYATYGTYLVTLTIVNSNGCTHSVSRNVLVYPKPIPEFSFSSPSCLGATVSFTNLSTTVPGYLDNIVTWIWDFGDGNTQTINFPANPNTTHVFAGPALSYTVRLTVITARGCSDYKEHVVNNIPSPLANFTFPATACEQTQVSFTDQSQVNGGSTIVGWSWNFDDIPSGLNNFSTAQNPSHSFTSAGTYDVQLIVTNASGCTDTIVKPVTVNQLPVANFSADTACHGSATTFTDLSVPNAFSIVSWAWNFGDGSPVNTQPSPTHTYPNYGTYTASLSITNTNGCSNSTSKNVLVFPRPIPAFTFSNPNCIGDVVTFTNQSTTVPGYIDNIATWVWNFGDGNTQTINFPANPNTTHVYTGTSTSYTVRLTVTTSRGCTDFIEHTVTLLPRPLANFTFPGSPCAQNLVPFTDLSQTNGGGTIVQWAWNFDDPPSGMSNNSTAQNPTHSFTSAGTYDVRLIVTNVNGCKDTVVIAVTVNARPVANFTADTACFGNVTQFTDQSTTSTGSITAWFWEFGDGGTGTGANPTHLYPNPATYTVKLTVTTSAGCTKDTTKQVIVYPALTAAFSYNSPACQGDSINFTDLSFSPHGYITTWVWNFGDGSAPVTINFPANPNVSHAYTNGGTFTVTLTVTNSDGCTEDKTNQVVIHYAPVANFSFTSGGCAQVGLQFTDLSQQNGGGAIIAWSWNFGDPASGTSNTSTMQNPTHAFSAGGTFNVNLMVTNITGCIDSTTIAVTINDAPLAQYSADTACFNLPTTFTDASTTGTGTVVGWLWNFGDPASGSNNTSTLQNPTHTFTNISTYSVNLQVTNSLGCIDDTTMQITVNPKPTAMFSYSAACLGSPTQFTDLSIATGSTITSWFWDFGDGTGTSTVQNPVYTYTAAGTYDVKLIVTNLLNCSDSVIMPVLVRNNPTAAFTYINFFCPEAQVNFQDQSLGAGSTITERLWIFEPGYTSTIPNPVHVFSQDDTTFAVTLIVTDNYGCIDTIIDSVYVKPGFSFTFNHDSVCYGYPMHFQPQNLAPGDSLFSVVWNFGDPASGPNNTSYLYNPTHVFTNPGPHVVKLKAWNTDNCVDSVYRDVIVYELPQPGFTYVTQPCDSLVSFTDLSLSGSGSIASWEWHFGDGSAPVIITAPGPGNTTHIYPNLGTYLVTLIVTNSNGCVDSISESVERYPCINAVFITDTLVCARNPVIFGDSSFPVDKISLWKWTFGDGLDTTYFTYSPSISHTFANPGNFIVKLVINAIVSGVSFSDSTLLLVRVKATPEPYFSNLAVCFNQTTLFLDTSVTFGEPNTSWYWRFGEPASGTADTSTLEDPSHKYLNPGWYDVTMIVANQWGCTDSLTKPTRVFDIPVAAYDNNIACLDNPTYFTDLSTASDTAIGFWHWNFGVTGITTDTSNLQNPEYIYDSTGTYIVRLIVRDYNGCRDTVDSLVIVNPTPLSAFTILEYIDGMNGKLQMQNLSSEDANAFVWNFGNGQSSVEENPIITYTEDGNYMIELISFNEFGCTDTTFYEYSLLFKGLYIPNAFAPSSNNLAVRLFKPVGINLKSYHIQVFDTWGHILWESSLLDPDGRPEEGWDGTFDGELMPQGNYMWKVSATFVDNSPWNGSEIGKGEASTMGTVTLIR